jgi:hypothetical protein
VDAGGEIVGHLAALPQYYRINGQRVVAHTPARYNVFPGYGFTAAATPLATYSTSRRVPGATTWRALLRGAVHHFRRLRVYSVRYRLVQSPSSPRSSDLWRLGFVAQRRRRSALLVKFADSALHETAKDTARWSYSHGDGEASFWMT